MPKAGRFAIPGIETVVPLLVIVLILFTRGNTLPGRGAATVERMPSAPVATPRGRRTVGPASFALLIVLVLFALGPDYRNAFTNSAIGVLVCLSVVVVTGYAGQLFLAPLAFGGISAFAVSYLSHDLGWPFPIPIFLGALVASAVGVVVALPALRIRGVNLAIITFAFALAVERAVFANPDVNGGIGRALVDTPGVLAQTKTSTATVLGFLTAGDGKQPNPFTALFCIVFAALASYLVANIRRSNTGRHFLSVRSNERAAASSNVNVAGTKTLSFALAAFLAGVAGAVIAYRSGSADEQRFTYQQSLVFFAFAYLGGLARVSGAIVGGLLVSGGVVFTFMENTLSVPEEFTLLLGGLGVIIAATTNPDGIAGAISDRFSRTRHRAGPASSDVVHTGELTPFPRGAS